MNSMRKPRRRVGQALGVIGVLALGRTVVTHAELAAVPKVDYVFTGDISLGKPASNDYLTFDPVNRRLYIAHFNGITVVDVAKRTIVGSVGPIKDSHGVALVPKVSKGYASSGDDGVVNVFNLSDLKIIKQIKVSPDADGVLYDEHSGTVLVVAGDSKNLTVINPTDDTVARTIGLPGTPEFMAIDGTGNVYVNIADIAALSKVNIASGKVEATWPLQNCKDPHGLAYDLPSNHLFSGCENNRLVVVDAADGRNLANLPIGPYNDSIAVDSHRRLAFAPDGAGALTAISIESNSVVQTVPTFFGGRNITIDPGTGALYVAHGHMKLIGSTKDPLNFRFGWDSIEVATFEPRP